MNKYIVFKSDFRKVDNIDEWTSFSDIGKIFNNKVLTMDEYLLIENKYLKFIEDLLNECNVKQLTIKSIEFIEKTNWKKGQKLNNKEIIKICKDSLREKCWVYLKSKNLNISFGYDYYLFIETSYDYDDIKSIISFNGLYINNYYEHINSKQKTSQINDFNEYLGFGIYENFYKLTNRKTSYIISFYNEGYNDVENCDCYYCILEEIRRRLFKKKYDETIYDNDNINNLKENFINEFNNIYNTNFKIEDLKVIERKKVIKIFYRKSNNRFTCIDITYEEHNGIYYFSMNKKINFKCESLNKLLEVISEHINSSKKIKKNNIKTIFNYQNEIL